MPNSLGKGIISVETSRKHVGTTLEVTNGQILYAFTSVSSMTFMSTMDETIRMFVGNGRKHCKRLIRSALHSFSHRWDRALIGT